MSSSQASALGATQGNDATSSTRDDGESSNPEQSEIVFPDDQEAALASFHEKWLPSLMEEIEDFRKPRSRGPAQFRKQPKGNQNRGPQNSRQMGGRRKSAKSMQPGKGDEKPAAKQIRGPQSSWLSRRIRLDTMEYQGINTGSMNDQGLTQDEDNVEGDGSRFKAPFAGRILELDSVNFEGEDFLKNKCYFVDNDNLVDERKDGYSVFAIKNFLKGEDTECESALCAELVLFTKTTMETVQNTSEIPDLKPKNIGQYVQRAGRDKEIPLADLGEELEDEELPAFKYFEKEKGSSSRRFGFTDTSKTPLRNGRRGSRLRAIDFYAGAGLASRGFERTGFEIIAGIEKDSDAAKSYSKIHGAMLLDVTSNACIDTFTRNPCKAIFHNTTEEFLTEYKRNEAFRKAIGPIDLVIFCPPCQGFSAENRYQEGNVEGNNKESLRVLDAAELIRPKCIVFENVCGMWRKEFIENYVQKIVYGLLDKVFNVQLGKLCAADFGDAQKRPRVIIIASLSQIGLPVYPRPTHGHSSIPFATVQDALRSEEGKHPEKENPINDDGAERDAKQPAPAVRASKSGPHYNENRFYTLVENAMLMGEGAWFVSKLQGNKAAKQRQIGNGVPGELAKAIGRALMGVLRWNWVGVDDIRHQSENDDEPMQWHWVRTDETNPQSEVNEPDIELEIKPEEIKSEFKTETKPENIKSVSDTDIRPETNPSIGPDTTQSAL